MKQLKQKHALRIGLFALGMLAFIGFLFFGSSPDLGIAGAQVVTCGALFLGGIVISDKNVAELKELRGEAQKKLEDMIELAKTQKRALTADEIEARDDLAKSLRDLKNEIEIKEIIEEEKRQAAGRKMKADGKTSEQREIEKYSIVKAFRSKIEGRSLDGIELEMHQEAEKEARDSGINITGLGIPAAVIDNYSKRAMTATGQTSAAGDQGGMLISTEIGGLVMALRPKLILAGLGAQTFGNMVGNIDIVSGTSTSASWKGENDDMTETASETANYTISPKRLNALAKISKQWLIQTNRAFESKIMDDLLAAIAQAVELAGINGTGSNNQPKGILAWTGIGSVIGGDNGAAPTYALITELESKLELANVNNAALGYLTNPKVKNKLKNTKLDAGSGLYVWPQLSNDLNGYKTAISTLVPSNLTKGTANAICSAILFGDFSGLEFYNWGGLDITIDPYTSKGKGQLEISVDSFWDTSIPEPKKFAAMLDALHA
jgi:HK97 family phage major capsid protein